MEHKDLESLWEEHGVEFESNDLAYSVRQFVNDHAGAEHSEKSKAQWVLLIPWLAGAAAILFVVSLFLTPQKKAREPKPLKAAVKPNALASGRYVGAEGEVAMLRFPTRLGFDVLKLKVGQEWQGHTVEMIHPKFVKLRTNLNNELVLYKTKRFGRNR